VGIEAVPSLGAGGNATVDVTIIPTLPNTSYDAAAWLAGSVTLLGGLSITSVTLLNTSTIRVVVHNGALVTLAGGTLIATAVAA
jgi:hypothetical protein